MINMILVPKPPENISSIHIQNRIYIIDTIRFSQLVLQFVCLSAFYPSAHSTEFNGNGTAETLFCMAI